MPIRTGANREGNDALMTCARHGLIEGVIALLERGADPRRANRHGTTALMQAARGHLIETVRVLLRAGADRTQADESGLTAARYARELGTPPLELEAMLAPGELGVSPELVRGVSRFDLADFRIRLMGSWSESTGPGGVFELTETTGERQIHVAVTHLPAELEGEERDEALAHAVGRQKALVSAEAGGACRFSEVRFTEAAGATQVRFSGVSGPPCASRAGADLFFAVCVYAAPRKFVTLTYRDHRPNMSEETRGLQASESVASFRVK